MKRLLIGKTESDIMARIDIEEEHGWVSTHAPRKAMHYNFYYVHVYKKLNEVNHFNLKSAPIHQIKSPKNCPVCGTEFIPKMVFQKYCCMQCKDKYHNDIRNARKRKNVGSGKGSRKPRL